MPATVPAKSPRKHLSARLREDVLWSGPCAYCGYDAPTQVDHVIPLSRGGTDDLTPDEWREWRLAEGLCWPPQSPAARIAEIFYQVIERYGRPPSLSKQESP